MQLVLFRVLCLLQFFKISLGHIFENKNLEINEIKNGLIIKNIYLISKINCIYLCQINVACEFILFNASNCILYSFYSRFYIQKSSSQLLIEKSNRRDTKLMHYWPIENGNANDLVDSKNMHSPFNAEFTEDRFGNPNSAINLTHGYMIISGGNYFGSVYTILAWVMVKSHENWQRLIDFGNGPNSENIIISLSNPEVRFYFRIFKENTGDILKIVKSNTVVQLNRWYHLGFVQDKGKMLMYVDGNREAYLNTGLSNLSRIMERTNCYFGKSNWNNNPNGNFIYDEVKFFDIALGDEEIKSEHNFGYH